MDESTQYRIAGRQQQGADRYGVDYLYSLRASKKLRLQMSRAEGMWKIEAFTHRGQKVFYSSEA